jgi:gliding motility-associated-like protein
MTQTVTSQGNPGLSYEWTDEAGNILGTGNAVEIDQPGTYIMNITDNVNGCSTPNQFTVLQDIEDPEVNAGPTSELTCTETIAALAGTGSEGSNFTYTWTTTDGSFSGPTDELEAFANAGGTYTLTIFNEDNRCSASSDVTITVDEDTPSGIEADAISPMCFGDPGAIFFDNIIGGVGPFMYSIDGGQTFSDEDLFSNLTPGVTYDLLIEDDNGCTVAQQLTIPTVDSLSVTVVETMVEIELGESFNINAFTTLPESEIVSITWSPADGLSCIDCLNPEVTPGFSTTYEVMVVSENGCVDNATIQFRVDRNIDIYIPNAFSPHNDDGINDLFMPFGKSSLAATIQSFQIYDRWGEQVFFDEDFQLNDPARGWNGVFRETDAPTGVYVYYIVMEFVDGSTELFEGDVTLMN